MTLAEGQGHSNWYQNAEISSVYYHTMFDRNRSLISEYKPMLTFVFNQIT